MQRLLVITALALTPALTHAGTSEPDACRFEQGDIPGETATMACFGALDENGDGSLSPAEAAALPRLEGRVSDLDRDNNGLLSPDEFQAEMTTPAQRGGGKGV